MSLNTLRRELELPKWPPAWNPFEVFILALGLFSSYTLLHGSSGSQVLDDRLSSDVVILWGGALAIGAAMALTGIWFYRTEIRLVAGLWLESGGLIIVGTMAAIYAFVVLHTAADVDGVVRSAGIQAAFAIACFVRAGQGYRALWRTRRVYLILQRVTRRSLEDD